MSSGQWPMEAGKNLAGVIFRIAGLAREVQAYCDENMLHTAYCILYCMLYKTYLCILDA